MLLKQLWRCDLYLYYCSEILNCNSYATTLDFSEFILSMGAESSTANGVTLSTVALNTVCVHF